METMTFDEEVDASGLSCPLPILRTAARLARMQSGQVVHVIATDPGSVKDFEAYARQTGHMLLENRTEGAKFHYLLRKK